MEANSVPPQPRAGRCAGDVVIVTGAADGIGRAAAIALAREGASLGILDRAAEGLVETQDLVEREGADVVQLCGDVTSREDVKAFVGAVLDRFGRIDGLVNNAGIVAGGTIEEISDDGWQQIMDVNAKSLVLLIQESLPGLRLSEAAAIVNVSSVTGGILGAQSTVAYCASKGAVVGMTKALAVDLGKEDIRVNVICPGVTDTGMPRASLAVIPESERERVMHERFVARQLQKRPAAPAEVANAIVFLVSRESSFITGASIPVDGGWSSW